MKFIDANVFLELMLDDEKAEECESFFNEVIENEVEIFTNDFIVYSCLLQIQQKIKSFKAMENFILFINSLNKLKIIRPSINDIYETIKNSEKYKLDFDDALILTNMLKNNIKNIISFDKHFDKINALKRNEP